MQMKAMILFYTEKLTELNTVYVCIPIYTYICLYLPIVKRIYNSHLVLGGIMKSFNHSGCNKRFTPRI